MSYMGDINGILLNLLARCIMIPAQPASLQLRDIEFRKAAATRLPRLDPIFLILFFIYTQFDFHYERRGGGGKLAARSSTLCHLV